MSCGPDGAAANAPTMTARTVTGDPGGPGIRVSLSSACSATRRPGPGSTVSRTRAVVVPPGPACTQSSRPRVTPGSRGGTRPVAPSARCAPSSTLTWASMNAVTVASSEARGSNIDGGTLTVSICAPRSPWPSTATIRPDPDQCGEAPAPPAVARVRPSGSAASRNSLPAPGRAREYTSRDPSGETARPLITSLTRTGSGAVRAGPPPLAAITRTTPAGPRATQITVAPSAVKAGAPSIPGSGRAAPDARSTSRPAV